MVSVYILVQIHAQLGAKKAQPQPDHFADVCKKGLGIAWGKRAPIGRGEADTLLIRLLLTNKSKFRPIAGGARMHHAGVQDRGRVYPVTLSTASELPPTTHVLQGAQRVCSFVRSLAHSASEANCLRSGCAIVNLHSLQNKIIQRHPS